MKFKLVESNDDRQKLIKHVGNDLAQKFFKIKHDIHNPKKKDLYYWLDKSPQELSDFIYQFEKKDGIVYKDSDWLVYRITSPEMLNNLVGRHKLWCIQNNDGGLDWGFHAEKMGTRYYLYIHLLDNKKYLRGINPDNFAEDGVWGEDNHTIRDKEFISSLPKVE